MSTMLIDWPKLSAALVLLLVPVALFHSVRVSYRDVGRSWEGYWLRTFGLTFHTFDLIRAVFGAWLLAEAIKRSPTAPGSMKYSYFAAQTAVFAVAVTLQTLFCKEKDSAHAPFAFVSGLVIGFLPPLVASLAIFLAVLGSLGANVATAYFPVLAIAVVGSGALLTGKKNLIALAAVSIAAGLPWLITLLFPRNLVSSFRAKKKIGEPSPLR